MSTEQKQIEFTCPMTREEAERIYNLGTEAAIFVLMELAKKVAGQKAASVSTPSGMKPPYEKDVQDLVWIILRSHFDRVEREDVLPRFGTKTYKPDFGIPALRTLIEVKFIGEKTVVARIQEEILADLPAYVGEQSRYDGVVVLVYDAAQKLRDPGQFKTDLQSAEGIIDVLVIPGVGMYGLPNKGDKTGG